MKSHRLDLKSEIALAFVTEILPGADSSFWSDGRQQSELINNAFGLADMFLDAIEAHEGARDEREKQDASRRSRGWHEGGRDEKKRQAGFVGGSER